MIVERFAPSPTGLLHLGHAFSALSAAQNADRFLLRIEDIDQPRCKSEFETAIYDDLKWLGLSWETPVLRQSARIQIYEAALNILIDKGLCYPCTCTRKDIQNALSAPQEGTGPDGPVYPNTCRQKKFSDVQKSFAIRLNMEAAIKHLDVGKNDLFFTEIGTGHEQTIQINPQQVINGIGDVVLARKDIGTSYHLSVVIDDAFQGITHVTRGLDMINATPIHHILQRLLNLPTPIYRHHALIRDQDGKRLAKRHDAMAIQKYREDGFSAKDVRKMVGY